MLGWLSQTIHAIKQAAKFVAGHNEEDGAAHFLEEWVL